MMFIYNHHLSDKFDFDMANYNKLKASTIFTALEKVIKFENLYILSF